MKKRVLIKRGYLVLAAALIAVAVILCGATLAGNLQSEPFGTKLTIPIGTDLRLVPNQNGGYFFIQNESDHTCISLLDRQGNVLQSQTFDKLFQSVCYTNKSLFILLNEDQSDFGISMITYQTDTTTLSHYKQTQLECELQAFTVSQNGTVYGVDYWDNTNLVAYPDLVDNGISSVTNVKTFEQTINALCTLPNDQLYVLLNDSDQVCYANASQGLPYQFSSQTAGPLVAQLPAQNTSNQLLMDTEFNLYTIHQDSSPIFTPVCATNFTSACFLPDHTILGAPYHKAYLELLSFDGAVQNKYDIPGECLALATNKEDTAIIFTQDDACYFVTLAELTHQNDDPSSEQPSCAVSIPIEEESSNPAEGESSKPTEDSSSDLVLPEQLESDQFIINRTNNTIYLPPSTTFAVLRDSLNSTKDTIVVKSLSNTKVSSGNLGTGYTVALQINGKIVDQLTILVRGDINGTGTVNSKDILLLYQYLNQSKTLSQTQLLACDLNDDGLVDTADLLILKKQVAAN